jgi:hypothetical protein
MGKMFRIIGRSAVETPVTTQDVLKKNNAVSSWKPALRKLRKGLFAKKEKAEEQPLVEDVEALSDDAVTTNLFARSSSQALNDQRATHQPRESHPTSPQKIVPSSAMPTREQTKDPREMHGIQIFKVLSPSTSHKNITDEKSSGQAQPPTRKRAPSEPRLHGKPTPPKTVRARPSSYEPKTLELDDFAKALTTKLRRESQIQERRTPDLTYVPKHAAVDFSRKFLYQKLGGGTVSSRRTITQNQLWTMIQKIFKTSSGGHALNT